MTNEPNRCKLETINELTDLRRHLVCLRTKADRFDKQLRGGLNQLQDVLPQSRPHLGGGKTPHADDWPTPAELTDLVDDYERTQKRIDELNERCRLWGFMD